MIPSEQHSPATITVRRLLPWAVLAIITVVLALAGFWLLFTTFMVYDDEGYVLLSLKNFSEHGGLYDQVYSQYGPFLYLFYDTLHRALGFAFNNTSARWITWTAWLGTAGSCAALVGRRTHSPLWSGFTLVGVFTYLWPMTREPIHPGGLIAFMVALGAWLGSEAWEAGRVRAFAIITAFLGTAMMLTKINVGIFFLGSAFVFLALNTRNSSAYKSLIWLGALGCAVMPFGLMEKLFDEPWVKTYSIVFTAASLAVLLTARTTIQSVVTARTWGWFTGVICGTTAIIVGFVIIRGTSPSGLIDGILLAPLRHPDVYFFPMQWRGGTVILAIASLILAAFVTHFGWLTSRQCHRAIMTARFVIGAVFLCMPLGIISTSPAIWGMCYGVTLAWLCIPALHAKVHSGGTRAWVALLLVFQFLHAYPVAGSQTNWSTFLWIPLLALGLHNALPCLVDMLPTWNRPVRILGGLTVALAALTMTGRLAEISWKRYHSYQPLNLPGAELIRLPANTIYDLRILVENLRAHADMVFSAPGLCSVNLWTGLPSPTLANTTQWFKLLPLQHQQSIITRMAESPHAVLVIQRDVLNSLRETGFQIHSPLYDWLMANFQCAFAMEGYEFWIRKGGKIAVLSTARFTQNPTGMREITLTLNVPPSSDIASIELCDLYAHLFPLLKLNGRNAKAFIEPIDLTGVATGPLHQISFPIKISGLNRLVLHFFNNSAPIATPLVILRDSNGSALVEAREIN